ncbi:MAG: thermonuclease family protein [Candidatus Gottesmanbacteria bacterium]|nr:thermonuclease family protein [Candidatus Gottesmanbacteria bacterium]
MQKGLWVVVVISVALNFTFICQEYERTRVTAVPDGDSLQLADGRRVRLLGIDAPEIGRCLADEARDELRSLVLGKHVRLKDIVTDDYGRVLAIVIVEDFPTWVSYMRSRILGLPLSPDPLVNRGMLSAGLARDTFSAPKDYAPTLKQAYDDAKSKKIGIFSSVCRTEPSGDCLIKGNIRDGKKTYHLPACDNYTQVIVDEAFGDHWFCSEAEAQAAGFVRASGCR